LTFLLSARSFTETDRSRPLCRNVIDFALTDKQAGDRIG